MGFTIRIDDIISEGKRLVAGAVVGHHALNLNAEAFVIVERRLEKGDGTAFLLAGHHLGEGDTGGIIDADMDIFPTGASSVALSSPIASDAVANLIEFAELFDVDMDQLARVLALVAPDRLCRFECA